MVDKTKLVNAHWGQAEFQEATADCPTTLCLHLDCIVLTVWTTVAESLTCAAPGGSMLAAAEVASLLLST